jgi:hypothetical protein
MSKRPTLRDGMKPPSDEATQAAAAAWEIQRQQERPGVTDPNGESGVMTTSTIHIPAELLNALRAAANRRSMRRITGRLDDRKNTRPSVSEIVVEMLLRHRDELDAMD